MSTRPPPLADRLGSGKAYAFIVGFPTDISSGGNPPIMFPTQDGTNAPPEQRGNIAQDDYVPYVPLKERRKHQVSQSVGRVSTKDFFCVCL